MLTTLNPRLVFLGITAAAVLSMAFAFYLEHQLELVPCPLCMTQRVFLALTGLIALIAALHNPQGWGRRVYGGLCTVAAAVGCGVAARHVWLQHLPEDQVPACGPSLEYMLDTLPFSETLSLVMMGDGNCAETVWTLFGFSIPEQTLALFVVLIVASVWQTLRR
ncbi:MAG: disulfide bond formation protein B [Halieaceae bacterium]